MQLKTTIRTLLLEQFECAAEEFAKNPAGPTFGPLEKLMWALQGFAQFSKEEVEEVGNTVPFTLLAEAIAAWHRNGTPFEQTVRSAEERRAQS